MHNIPLFLYNVPVYLKIHKSSDPFYYRFQFDALLILGHTVVFLLAWPGVSGCVCVCVCCLYFTWQESGTMLRLCLLFRNALGSPAQRKQLALPSDGRTGE